MFLPVILCVCDVTCSSGCGGKDWVRYEMFFFSFSILKVEALSFQRPSGW